MKKFLLMIAVLAFTASAFAKNDNDTTVFFRVNPPMHCENCETKIKSNVRFEKGVKNIETSVKDSLVTVRYEKGKTNVEAISKSFKKIGYDATPVSACKSVVVGCSEKKEGCKKATCKGDGSCKKAEATCKGDGSCKKAEATCKGDGSCKKAEATCKGDGSCKKAETKKECCKNKK